MATQPTQALELRAEIPARRVLLTAEECASLVGCNVKVWRRWCKDARMPQPVRFPFPVSRDLRWHKSEVMAWIDNLIPDRRHEPSDEEPVRRKRSRRPEGV